MKEEAQTGRASSERRGGKSSGDGRGSYGGSYMALTAKERKKKKKRKIFHLYGGRVYRQGLARGVVVNSPVRRRATGVSRLRRKPVLAVQQEANRSSMH